MNNTHITGDDVMKGVYQKMAYNRAYSLIDNIQYKLSTGNNNNVLAATAHNNNDNQSKLVTYNEVSE